VDQAQRQQEGEAERVVVEIERGGRRTGGRHRGQPRLRHRGPADHVGFDEPVEVVIGVDEGEQAGQPGVEHEAGYAEQTPQGRADIAEIILADPGKARDPDFGGRGQQQNRGDRDEVGHHQRGLCAAAGPVGAEHHEDQREQRDVDERWNQDADDGERRSA